MGIFRRHERDDVVTHDDGDDVVTRDEPIARDRVVADRRSDWGGPPLVLARLGRPWPTRWPSLSEFGDAMRSTDVPTGPVLKAVALVGWVAWAVEVAGVGATAARRSPARRLDPASRPTSWRARTAAKPPRTVDRALT